MNNENLIPFSERSEKEARELGRKGGIKSGQVRREKSIIQQSTQWVMDAPVLGPNRTTLLGQGLTEEQLKTQWPAIVAGLKNKAMQGNVNAIKQLIEMYEGKNTLTQLKEKELELKERELRLKEEYLNKDSSNDGVTIINDLYEYNKD